MVQRGKVVGASPSGWPDRFVAHRLWRGYLECKDFNGVVDPLQKRILQQLNERKQDAFVLRFGMVAGTTNIHSRLETADGNHATAWFSWSQFFQTVTEFSDSLYYHNFTAHKIF